MHGESRYPGTGYRLRRLFFLYKYKVRKGDGEMPHGRKVICPMYVTHRYGAGGWDYTITCELIRSNMGFEMRNQLRFRDREEQTAYLELFCCAEQYGECPYFQAFYKDGNRPAG